MVIGNDMFFSPGVSGTIQLSQLFYHSQLKQLNYTGYCFRLTNATHQIGCSGTFLCLAYSIIVHTPLQAASHSHYRLLYPIPKLRTLQSPYSSPKLCVTSLQAALQAASSSVPILQYPIPKLCVQFPYSITCTISFLCCSIQFPYSRCALSC